MDTPVAVIINTCNRPFLLKDLVRSVGKQLGKEDWIVIVNDGEQGGLPEFDVNSITVVDHCKDYYALASGRNKGIDKAIDLGYDWGLFLDDDVRITEDLLQNHKNAWSEKEAIYAGKIVNNEGTIEAGKIEDKNDIRKEWHDSEEHFILKWGGANVSFHLPSLRELGGFNEDFDGHWGAEDVELYLRLVKEHNWDIQYIPEAKLVSLYAPTEPHYQRGDPINVEKLPEDVYS